MNQSQASIHSVLKQCCFNYTVAPATARTTVAGLRRILIRLDSDSISILEPLRNGTWDQFRHGSLTLIRYDGSYKDANGNSVALIPADEAYFLPLGTADSFKTYFSPANKFDLANTLGEQAYIFEYADGKGSKIEIESESNLINILRRPAIVVRAVAGATV